MVRRMAFILVKARAASDGFACSREGHPRPHAAIEGARNGRRQQVMCVSVVRPACPKTVGAVVTQHFHPRTSPRKPWRGAKWWLAAPDINNTHGTLRARTGDCRSPYLLVIPGILRTSAVFAELHHCDGGSRYYSWDVALQRMYLRARRGNGSFGLPAAMPRCMCQTS